MGEPKTGVITGATSGIGAAFAHAFAAQGYNLILTGRREPRLSELAQEIKDQYDVSVQKQLIELADVQQVNPFIDALRSQPIDLLINNAGFGMRSTFLQAESETLEQMVTVHSTVPMQLMHALLPGMKERRSGIMINVASIAGFFPLPRSGVYAATKAFLTLLSESLYVELKGTGVKVQALCPGMTITDFHSRLGKDPERYYKKRGVMKAMTPRAVVKASLKCLDKDKPVCIPGGNNRLLANIPRFLNKSMLYKLARAARNRETE